jgi:hypothetical protein
MCQNENLGVFAASISITTCACDPRDSDEVRARAVPESALAEDSL